MTYIAFKKYKTKDTLTIQLRQCKIRFNQSAANNLGLHEGTGVMFKFNQEKGRAELQIEDEPDSYRLQKDNEYLVIYSEELIHFFDMTFDVTDYHNFDFSFDLISENGKILIKLKDKYKL